MLAVCFDDALVAVGKRRLNENVTEVSLECRMQVNFRLLNGQDAVLGSIGAYQHREHLADADTNIPVAHHRVGAAIREDQLVEFIGFGVANRVNKSCDFSVKVLDSRNRSTDVILVAFLPFHIKAIFAKPFQRFPNGRFKLIEPNQVPNDQFVWRLEAVRRIKPFVDQGTHTSVSADHVPRVPSACVPIRIVMLSKRQVAGRIGSQGPQVLKPRHLPGHNLVYTFEDLINFSWQERPDRRRKVLPPSALAW